MSVSVIPQRNDLLYTKEIALSNGESAFYITPGNTYRQVFRVLSSWNGECLNGIITSRVGAGVCSNTLVTANSGTSKTVTVESGKIKVALSTAAWDSVIVESPIQFSLSV